MAGALEAEIGAIVWPELARAGETINRKLAQWVQQRTRTGETQADVLNQIRQVLTTMREEHAHGLETVTQAQGELRRENETLREAKAALAAIQSEGLLTFVHKINADAFKLVVAVLVQGDVAKAARALELELEPVRWRLRVWRKSRGVYRGLAELIRWRKGKRMASPCEFKDALAKVVAGTDRETVLSEVLSGLRSMTDGNWQDVCADLKVELRKLVG